MAIFNISNFYTNTSQWNKELLLDGNLYTASVGNYVYLMTTTGIMRYMYNQASKSGDYGVFNRDISYVSYEIPSPSYTPSILGSIVGFVNSNGVFCALNMADGVVNRFGSWVFDITPEKRVSLWAFINKFGNQCFVIGDVLLDITYKENGNCVGSVSAVCASGFTKFKDGNELVLLKAPVSGPVYGNFVQTGIALNGFSIDFNRYGEYFYIRDIETKRKLLADDAYDSALEYFGNNDEEERTICVNFTSMFNTASNDVSESYDYEEMTSFYSLGFDFCGSLLPVLVNPSANLIQVPKTSLGFSDVYFSTFTKYLSNAKDGNAFSNYFVEFSCNDQVLKRVPLMGFDGAKTCTSFSKFVEFPTNNSTNTHMKMSVKIVQTVSVDGEMIEVSMQDSIYLQALAVVLSINR